jgi:hypothetical protein
MFKLRSHKEKGAFQKIENTRLTASPFRGLTIMKASDILTNTIIDMQRVEWRQVHITEQT